LTGSSGVAATTGRAFDYSQHQYGVRYALSKRSTAYIATGKQTDSAAATTAFASSKYSAIGLMHAF
jgi:predicted porin